MKSVISFIIKAVVSIALFALALFAFQFGKVTGSILLNVLAVVIALVAIGLWKIKK